MLDVIGGIIGSGVSAISQERANRSNERIARENRAWQERMSNTAHAREVKDLRNAGLNPILSATGGSGASSPSGNVATMSPVVTPDTVNSAVGAYAKHLQRRQLENTVRMTDQAIKTQQSQQVLNSAQAVNALAGARSQTELAGLYRENALSSAWQNWRSANEAPAHFKRNMWWSNPLIGNTLGAGSAVGDLIRNLWKGR